MLKLGDAVIPYHESFKLYITTKLPNPHYSPEVSTNITLINFTVSPRYMGGTKNPRQSCSTKDRKY